MPFGTDPVGTDPVGTDPVGTDPVGTAYVRGLGLTRATVAGIASDRRIARPVWRQS